MLVDCDLEVPVRRFSLNYLQHGPTQSPLLNPSSHVILALGCHRSCKERLPPRPSTLAPTPLHPPETLVTHDVGRRIRPTDGAGSGFLNELHQLRRWRPSAAPDGWIHSRQDVEPAPVSLIFLFFLPHAYASSSLSHLPMIIKTLDVQLHQQ